MKSVHLGRGLVHRTVVLRARGILPVLLCFVACAPTVTGRGASTYVGGGAPGAARADAAGGGPESEPDAGVGSDGSLGDGPPAGGDAAVAVADGGGGTTVASAPDGGAVAAIDGGLAVDLPASEMFRGQPVAAVLDALAHRPIVRVLSRHDSTGVIYRVDLGDGLEAGFKPARRGQENWWRHEIIAFRLARRLGLAPRTPPVVARLLPLSLFPRWARSDDLTPAASDRHMVAGAMIYWLPVLRPTNLYTPDGQRRWSAWLDARRPVAAPERDRPEQVSSMVVFDYLMGNLDRFNFANIRTDENGVLVYRDNNAGWFANQMTDLRWVRTELMMVQRFSRAVVDAVDRTDAAALRAEVERDPGADGALLSDEQLNQYERRRRHVLGYVHGLVAQHGEARVYAWP